MPEPKAITLVSIEEGVSEVCYTLEITDYTAEQELLEAIKEINKRCE